MIWLLVPIIIWSMALLVMILPKLMDKSVQKLKKELHIKAELAEQTNLDESIYNRIEEGILDIFPLQTQCFISATIGGILMALGTVALCVVLLH